MSELEKIAENREAMLIIIDFIDWCDTQKIELATWNSSGRSLRPIVENRIDLAHRYFDIDQQQLERERRALIASTTEG